MVKVLIATSEAVPFAKTGGLADVCGALPAELAKLGNEIGLIMPAYACVKEAAAADGIELKETGRTVSIPVGNQIIAGTYLTADLPGNVKGYFVDQPEYFDRPSLYGENGVDYRDNCERFVFFSRAVLEAIRTLDLEVDLIHCNDWQTALVPTLIDAEYRITRGYERLATLLTIHNMAYQGRFWHWDMLLTGLDWRYFNWRSLEFFGDLNLLKGGIVYADAINTVSPTYAREIQTPGFGCGLEGVLTQRSNVLSGILNGVDYGNWNPKTDSFLAASYDADDWQKGKATCKAELQKTMGLDVNPDVPIVGFVGRLAEQKGVELIAQLIRKWSGTENVQWAILGTGSLELETELAKLSKERPHRVAAQLAFSNEMAHKIEAGSDVFLMPSRYEPCGLNQMYSLKYGTPPLVHATGGLKDTVVNATEEAIAAKAATGFVFYDYDLHALESTLRWAVTLYNERRDDWNGIVSKGMNQDWSWSRSANAYSQLYAATSARVKQIIDVR